MKDKLKRVSLMLKEDQQTQLNQMGINLSGLVRDLLDDHLSEHKITVSVTEDTYRLYDKVVSNTGCTDVDLEKYFRKSLRDLLENRILAMQELEKELHKAEM